MSVVEAAGKLFEFLAARDTSFTRHLRPGLSRVEIHALVDPLGVVLPEEALQFYEHYSLPKGYQYIPKHPNGLGQPSFFGIYWMLGLEDAIDKYRSRNYSEIFTAADEFIPGENEGSSGWFPFLESNGDTYLLDTFHETGNLCPIIHVFRDSGPESEFVSMTAMFETMYDWANEDVLAVEEGHMVGDYDGDSIKVGQIAVRHNPGIASWERMAAGEE